MNSFYHWVLGSLLILLCFPLQAQPAKVGSKSKTWHLSAMALVQHTPTDFQDFQLQGWGFQLESSLPFICIDLRLGLGLTRANSAFHDPVKTKWLRQYQQKKVTLRLQYHFFPDWQFRPFLFTGVENEQLGITYSSLERRNFTEKQFNRPLAGAGLDLTLFRRVRLRIEGSYGNGIQAKLGLGVCWAG